MNEHQKPAYWAVLPATVRYDPGIPSTAKLLYAEISSLTDSTGYCFASNEFLASTYEISVKSVQRLLKNLSDAGYIEVDVVRDPESNEVLSRRIFAGINPAGGLDTPHLKNKVRSPQKCGDPSPQKCGVEQYNNIIINNKGQTVSDPTWKTERFKKLWSFYPHKYRGHKKRAVQAWDKLKLSDEAINQVAIALQKQMKSELWKRGIGIPHLSTYLNGAYWTEVDDVADTECEASGWADDPEVL